MIVRAICVAAVVAGCVPSTRELRAPVANDLAARLGDDAGGTVDDPRVAAAIAARLREPIDRDAAVKIALANNPRMRAALAELGVAAGGLALALGPAMVELDHFASAAPAETEVRVVQELLGLVTLPRRRAAASAELAAARAEATAQAVQLAARVEIAFSDLLAAQQQVGQRRVAFDAADAAALLRERMHAAGAATDLAQARDRDAREQARIELARAEAGVELRREAVNALLGLTGEATRWTARGELPALPATAPALDAIEATAVTASLELAAARARVDAAANTAGVERVRSVLPHVGAGVVVGRRDGDTVVGPTIEVGVPLLDWNAGGRSRANARLARAEHELAARAIELRAAARAARITTLATYAEARHVRDVVLPLRQQILDETVKHYNAMNADPFALVLARRELADAQHQLIDAQRRFANALSAIRALERGAAIVPPADAGPAAPTAPPSAQEQHR